MKHLVSLVLVLILAAGLTAACGASTESPAVQPSATPEVTESAATAAPTDTPVPEAAGNADSGAALFVQHGCSGCHGAQAGGGRGPTLAGRGLQYEAALSVVRSGRGGMPSFAGDQLSDDDVQDIVAWLDSL